MEQKEKKEPAGFGETLLRGHQPRADTRVHLSCILLSGSALFGSEVMLALQTDPLPDHIDDLVLTQSNPYRCDLKKKSWQPLTRAEHSHFMAIMLKR